MDDLLERLRRDILSSRCGCQLLREAADAIERLQAEKAQLTKDVAEARWQAFHKAKTTALCYSAHFPKEIPTTPKNKVIMITTMANVAEAIEQLEMKARLFDMPIDTQTGIKSTA